MADRRRPDAILIVHGIGEQVSNDTARSLAEGLADRAEDRVRSAPDLSIDGAKQREYAIVWDINAPKVSPESHVSEGYWAYRFRDTTWSHLTGWLLPLVRRPRREAPERLRVGNERLSNLIVGAAAAAGLFTVIGIWADVPLGTWLATKGYVAAAGLGAAAIAIGLFMFFPRRAVPLGAGVAVVTAVGLTALLDPLFDWLTDRTTPAWLNAAYITALVLLVLASLAVDVLTSVRVLAVITVTVVLTLLGTATNQQDAGATVLALIAAAAAPWASAAAASLLLPSLGDAARYFRDHPNNEDESRHIRKIVIDKLRALHEFEDGEPRFERVIVIGHSLGSVIAYDAINHFWAEANGRLTVGGPPTCETCASRDLAVLQLEAAAHNLTTELDDDASPEDSRQRLAAYRDAQWNLSTCLRAEPTKEHGDHPTGLGPRVDPRWLVTDFITVGSPLASVGFLAQPGGRVGRRAARTDSGWRRIQTRISVRTLRRRPEAPRPDAVDELIREVSEGGPPTAAVASGTGSESTGLPPDDIRVPASWFESKLAAREYPSCPPLSQSAAAVDPIVLFSNYPLRYSRGSEEDRQRHLHHAAAFAPVRWTNVYFENDLIGGPVSAQLGRGILDIEVAVKPPTPRNFVALFSHTSYWTEPLVEKLRVPAATSREVLTDLVELSVDADTSRPIEVADMGNRPDVVWCASSPAQTATRERLALLESARRNAFRAARLATTWSETMEVLAGNQAADGAALWHFVERIHREHQDACVVVAAYREIALYRLKGGDLDRFEYRMLELMSHDGMRRCRAVTEDLPWPGAVEQMGLEAAWAWVNEFLTADIGKTVVPVD